MEIIVKITVTRADGETRNMPDPHTVAEALIEHLKDPSDPEDLVFLARRRGNVAVELQMNDVDLVNVGEVTT